MCVCVCVSVCVRACVCVYTPMLGWQERRGPSEVTVQGKDSRGEGDRAWRWLNHQSNRMPTALHHVSGNWFFLWEGTTDPPVDCRHQGSRRWQKPLPPRPATLSTAALLHRGALAGGRDTSTSRLFPSFTIMENKFSYIAEYLWWLLMATPIRWGLN